MTIIKRNEKWLGGPGWPGLPGWWWSALLTTGWAPCPPRAPGCPAFCRPPQKSSLKEMAWLSAEVMPDITPAFWYSPTRFSKKLVLPLQPWQPWPEDGSVSFAPTALG